MKKAAFLALCGLALASHSLEVSAGHPYPMFDEIDYVQRCREAGQRGFFGTIGCHFSGECRDDNRNPLYMMAVGPMMDGSAEDFTRGKLFGLLPALLLLVAAFFLTERAFGTTAGFTAAAALALSPMIASAAQALAVDGLFALLYFAALWSLPDGKSRPRDWIVFGGLAGLAFLAKGNGYFLLLVPLLHGTPRERATRFAVASIAFVALAGFLLWRNIALWGNPLHNMNNKVFWLDSFREYYLLSPLPEWDKVDALWYFQRHGFGDALVRFTAGLGTCAMKLTKAIAVGPPLIWQLTGALLLGLAGAGMRRAWKEGRRERVLDVGVPAAVLLLAFAWGMPSIGVNLRYLVPLVAAFLPFAAFEAATLAKKRSRFLEAGLAAACAVMLLSHVGGLALKPLSLWSVTPGWRETSAWLAAHGDAAGYVADPSTPYSEWDAGPVRRVSYPFDASPEMFAGFLKERGFRLVLHDAAVTPPRPEFRSMKREFASSDGRFTLYGIEPQNQK